MTENEFVMSGDFTFLIIRSESHGVISFLVDNDDVERIKKYKWAIMKVRDRTAKTLFKYYAIATTGKNLLLHRFVVNAPKGSVVNHKNGNTLDMRKRNLKVGTYNDNNRGVKRRRNSSGVTGVSWTKNVNRWHAYIGYQGKHISLRYFDKLDEAVAARKKAEKEYGYPE